MAKFEIILGCHFLNLVGEVDQDTYNLEVGAPLAVLINHHLVFIDDFRCLS